MPEVESWPFFLTSIVALGKLLNLSVPQFPHWENRNIDGTYLIRLLCGLSELIYVNSFLTHKYSINYYNSRSHTHKKQYFRQFHLIFLGFIIAVSKEKNAILDNPNTQWSWRLNVYRKSALIKTIRFPSQSSYTIQLSSDMYVNF